MISKLVCSPFYIFDDTFDAVPIPVRFRPESEPVSVECNVKPRNRIDEKHGVGDVVVLSECREEAFGQCLRSGRKEPDVENFVGNRIDGSVQPEALIVEVDHGLVERNVIRAAAVDWL